MGPVPADDSVGRPGDGVEGVGQSARAATGVSPAEPQLMAALQGCVSRS